MLNIFKNLYVHQRFYVYISIISALFLVSFWLPILYLVAWFCVLVLITLFFGDIYLLFKAEKGVEARRLLTEKFSNSDENPITITLKNKYPFKVEVKIIDE